MSSPTSSIARAFNTVSMEDASFDSNSSEEADSIQKAENGSNDYHKESTCAMLLEDQDVKDTSMFCSCLSLSSFRECSLI